MTETADIWLDWLRHYRHGGDATHEAQMRGKVTDYVDRILDAAALQPGMTLLDLGAGEGVVGLRAIERIGAELNIIMTDISQPLLDAAQAKAAAAGVLSQCRFLVAAADDLAPVPDASADVVTSRAVLAYVDKKARAFAESFRVLKPGGRLSIAEPLFRDEALDVIAMKRVLDQRAADVVEPVLPLLHRWKATQFPDDEAGLERTAITNYTERDFVRYARETGFTDVHLELHIDVRTARPMPWEVFLNKSPHPLAPTLKDVLSQKFSPAERQIFEQALRPRLQAGGNISIERMIYLTALKPARQAPRVSS